MFFAATGKAGFLNTSARFSGERDESAVNCAFLFLFLGGALDIVGRVGATIALRPIWSWPALRPRRDQRSSVSHHSDHCSNVNRKGVPRLTAFRLWLE